MGHAAQSRSPEFPFVFRFFRPLHQPFVIIGHPDIVEIQIGEVGPRMARATFVTNSSMPNFSLSVMA